METRIVLKSKKKGKRHNRGHQGANRLPTRQQAKRPKRRRTKRVGFGERGGGGEKRVSANQKTRGNNGNHPQGPKKNYRKGTNCEM